MYSQSKDQGLHGLEDILGVLGSLERGLLENGGKRSRLSSGEKIIGSLIARPNGGSWVNVIPGGSPGDCREVLVVAIGYNDSANERILEAVEHIKSNCPGKTNRVLFWAAWWGVPEWRRHRHSFAGVQAALKLVGLPAIPL